MPNDDITHPIPDLTGYITEGADRAGPLPGPAGRLSAHQCSAQPVPPDEGRHRRRLHRADHADVSNQLFASYAKVNDARDLASVIGEEELGETDKLYLDFGAHFERNFWARAPMRTAPSTRAWTLAGACSPSHSREELDRVDEAVLEQHYRKH